MTDAMIGYDSSYEIFYGGEYVAVGEVTNITPGEATTDRVDATHMKSAGRRREKISGLIDSGEGSLDINWVPGNGTDVMLRTLQTSGANVNHRITFPNGVTVVFMASIMSVSKAVPLDDKMSATVGVSISGAETWGSASAPANTALPAISGIAQVGEELTAWEGIWTGAPTFTYVWEADGTPIGGATAKTYTPVVGQIGDVITVVVTATNSHSAVTAESVGTAAVIAA
jgi:hypothetical protein